MMNVTGRTTELLLIACFLCAPALAQEARLIDEFPWSPCGDFMARMDNVFYYATAHPTWKIYIVYYGALFRKETVAEGKERRETLKLAYPHRDDALNRAKAIPLYLTTYRSYPESFRESVKNRMFLVEGGYEHDMRFQIWFAPEGAGQPKIEASLDAKEVRFGAGRPYRVPDFTKCYENY